MESRIRTILMTAGAAMFVAGCGSDPAPENAAAQVAKSVATTAMGMEVSTADLPAFVELPADARAVQRMNSSQNGQKGGMIVVETATSPAEVLAFYRALMARNGMKVAMETTTGDGAMLVGGTEGDGRMLSIIVSPSDEGKTNVAITHGEKQG